MTEKEEKVEVQLIKKFLSSNKTMKQFTLLFIEREYRVKET